MARTVKFTYATRVDGGDILILPHGMRPLLFSFWLLISHDIAQGIQRGKVGGGHAGTPKVRLPTSYRTMPPEVRY
jgi:hypothetical protein